jgi:hypothetical protein
MSPRNRRTSRATFTCFQALITPVRCSWASRLVNATTSARPSTAGSVPWSARPSRRLSENSPSEISIIRLTPMTCNEVQHLYAALLARPAGDLGHRLGWSVWRRRHQARARTCHYQRQAALQP